MTDSPDTASATGLPRPGGVATLAGHSVARVGYGAMHLDRFRDDRSAGVTLLRRVVALGVNHIDTAQFYGLGFSNELLQEAIRPEDGVLIVTKVGAEPNPDLPGRLRMAQRPEQLRAGVEANLKGLGLEQLPVVNLRRSEDTSSVQAEADQIVDLDDQLAVMIEMRDEGKIGGIGLSSIGLDTLQRALPVGIVCVQNAYSLVARSSEDLLDLCLAEDIAWVPYFPLGSAFPQMPKVTDAPAVKDVAAQLGVSPSEVGLAWLLQHTPNTLLIAGTTNTNHLEANVKAGSVILDTKTMAVLDAI